MLKWILFMASALIIAESAETPKPTREMIVSTHDPVTVALGSQLFTVSKNRTHLNITSNDTDYKPCILAVEEYIYGRTYGAVFHSKIAVWGTGKVNPNSGLWQVEYVMLILDQVECSYKALPIVKDRHPVTEASFFASFVFHRDYFDIFFPSQKFCYPCRFDTDGKKIELKMQAQPESVYSYKKFHVQANDPTERTYVYAVEFKNQKSVLKILEQDFKATKHVNLDHAMDSIAVAAGNSLIGVYNTDGGTPQAAYYSLYDSDLKLINRIKLPLLENHHVYKCLVSIDSQGNSYVTFIQQIGKLGTDRKISLLRYDVKGQLVSELDLGKLEDSKSYDVQALLISSDEFSLVTHEMYGSRNGVTNIKWYNISNKLGF